MLPFATSDQGQSECDAMITPDAGLTYFDADKGFMRQLSSGHCLCISFHIDPRRVSKRSDLRYPNSYPPGLALQGVPNVRSVHRRILSTPLMG
ncbi:unnamed protein product [Somion occarium]|uniref:Uncharacterized protein n=1 Tax=Somion occarium TaxID=3059160 RepID=A0ABP1CU51_9APHY